MQIDFWNRVSLVEKLLFTKHLAVMVKSGISLIEALETLESQVKSNYFKIILNRVEEEIKNGQSLATALGKYPRVFDQFYLSLIEVGEASGTLEANLEFLAKQLDKDYLLSKKIQGALMYPGLVLSMTVVMGSFISLFILPKLVDFFDAFEMELPVSTKILLGISLLMKNYGYWVIGGGLMLTGTIMWAIKQPSVKPYWHKMMLKLPLVGVMISYGQLSRFSRNLGTLLKSGIPVMRGLEITAETLSNIQYRSRVVELVEEANKGKGIGETMRTRKYKEFPALVAQMVGVGEKTGKLDQTLLYLSDFYDEEIDGVSKNLSTVLEPILLLVIGLAVGFIALAIISPIYGLTGKVG
jgi:type IV pilus assembly protein PilC